jgi:hypothetical protein
MAMAKIGDFITELSHPINRFNNDMVITLPMCYIMTGIGMKLQMVNPRHGKWRKKLEARGVVTHCWSSLTSRFCFSSFLSSSFSL